MVKDAGCSKIAWVHTIYQLSDFEQVAKLSVPQFPQEQ